MNFDNRTVKVRFQLLQKKTIFLRTIGRFRTMYSQSTEGIHTSCSANATASVTAAGTNYSRQTNIYLLRNSPRKESAKENTKSISRSRQISWPMRVSQHWKAKANKSWDVGGGCCHLFLPRLVSRMELAAQFDGTLECPEKQTHSHQKCISRLSLFLSVYSLSVRLLPPLRLALLMYPDFPVSLPLPFNTFHLCPMPSGSCFLAKKSRRCQWLIMPPFLLLINLVKNQ